jgi:aspartyl-tRNA(Asn)/glutamyl-tRNA(Gln) amidotransferase subunit A
VTAPFASLHSLAAALADRRITPAGVMAEVMRRHDVQTPRLDAYVAWGVVPIEETGPGPALAPLAGIPVSIKDCIGVAGLPTFAGTGRRLPARWESDGPIVTALRQQSAILVGKTVQTEFALSALGQVAGSAQPRNPWDAEHPRSAGGSSTGAALSLLEGSALLALGTDTMGSVRIPASVTGVVGFRPAAGRWPTDGVVPLSPTFDTVGLLANDVADVRFAFEAIERALAGPRAAASAPDETASLRIGLLESVWAGCESSIARAGQEALRELMADGCASIVTVALPEAAEAFSFLQDSSVTVAEFDAFLAAHLPEFRARLSPPTAALAERGQQTLARRYLNDREWLRRLTTRTALRFANVDLLAFPTVPLMAPLLDELDQPDTRRHFHLGMLKNTCIASVLGLCAISIPVGRDAAGIPVGLELVALPHREDFLLSAAGIVEQRLGTRRERFGEPPLLARAPAFQMGTPA